MTKVEAKRWVCSGIAAVVRSLGEQGWPHDLRTADPAVALWSEADRDRIDAAVKELLSELERRGV